jgi:flagellin
LHGGEILIINTDVTSLKILDTMARNNRQISKSLERLSTGLRINSAADDPVGMARGQRLESQIRGTRQAIMNVETAKNMASTADGVLEEIQSAIQRMRELAVYAANDSLTDEDREYVQAEIEQLTEHIDSLIGNTQFNRIKLFKNDALAYFENTVISQVAKNSADSFMLKDTINSLLDLNLHMKDIYESIFSAIDKYREENGAESGAAVFDRDKISLRILNLNDIDLSTLEKATENVERVNTALERVASYVAAESDEGEKIEANATLAPDISNALNGNLALNAAFRSVFDSLELLAKETSPKNEPEDDEETVFRAYLHENVQEGLAAARETDETVFSAFGSLGNLCAKFPGAKGFSGAQLMRGNNFYIQAGPNEGDRMTLDLGFVNAVLGVRYVDLSDREHASSSLSILDKALDAVSAQRAMVGAQIDMMDHRIDYLENSAIIAESTYSRIMDADMAKEMLTYVKLSLSNQVNNMLLKQVANMRQRAINLLMPRR